MSIWFILLAIFVLKGTGTQYRLVFPKAPASRKTDQWTGRRKIEMDSGQYQHNLKLLKQGPSCLLLDVESAKITPGRNAAFNKSFSECCSPVTTLRKGKIRRSSCDEYKEYPRLCFHVIHFNRAYTVRKNLC